MFFKQINCTGTSALAFIGYHRIKICQPRKMKKEKFRHKNKYLFPVQDTLDLHEFTREQAVIKVKDFLKNAKDNNYKKVRIITGKGLHSASGKGILKRFVENIIENASLKYSEAKINEGGGGAIDIEF